MNVPHIGHVHLKVSGVHIELFVGSKCKAHIVALGIVSSADDDVGGGADFQSRRNQEFRLRLIGIDVISAHHAKCKRHLRCFALCDRNNGSGRHAHDRLHRRRFLAKRAGSEQDERTCK